MRVSAQRPRSATSAWVLVIAGALGFAACGKSHEKGGGSTASSSGGSSSGSGGSGGGTSGSGAATGGSPGSGGTSSSSTASSSGGSDGRGATGSGGGPGTGGGAGMVGSGGGGGDGMPIDEFCELLQPRARQWLRECRSNFGDAMGWWGTERIDAFCSSGREAVEAGRLSFDPMAAERCAALSVGGCENLEVFAYNAVEQNPQSFWLQSDECAGVVTGQQGLGDDCHPRSSYYAQECSEGFCSTDTCPGVCTEYSQVNDPCDNSSSMCDPATSFCNGGGVCQTYLSPGDDCETDRCHPDDMCRFVEDDETLVCIEIVGLGETCDPLLDQCEFPLGCKDDECVEELDLGDRCSTDTHCPDGAYCNGTCQTYVAVDGDCSDGKQCVAEAYCDGATCLVWGGENDPCPCEPGLFCDDENTCQVRGGPGFDCEPASGGAGNDRCESGLSCLPSSVQDGMPTSFECQATDGDLGEECSPSLPGTCRAPYFCHPQLYSCSEPGGEGEPCNAAMPNDSCQPGHYCVCVDDCVGDSWAQVAECQAKAEDGEDCTLSSLCLSNRCDVTCQPDPVCR